jgi:hypothetical protein
VTGTWPIAARKVAGSNRRRAGAPRPRAAMPVGGSPRHPQWRSAARTSPRSATATGRPVGRGDSHPRVSRPRRRDHPPRRGPRERLLRGHDLRPWTWAPCTGSRSERRPRHGSGRRFRARRLRRPRREAEIERRRRGPRSAPARRLLPNILVLIYLYITSTHSITPSSFPPSPPHLILVSNGNPVFYSTLTLPLPTFPLLFKIFLHHPS